MGDFGDIAKTELPFLEHLSNSGMPVRIHLGRGYRSISRSAKKARERSCEVGIWRFAKDIRTLWLNQDRQFLTTVATLKEARNGR